MLELIKIDAAEEGMTLAKNIYDLNGNLLISSGSELKPRYIEHLKNNGQAYIYVGSLPPDMELPEPVSEKLRLTATKCIKNISESLRAGSKTFKVLEVKNLAELIIKEFEQESNTFIATVDPKNVEDYRYRHAVNVALISLVIAKSLFLTKEKIKMLVTGALLHDIGSAFIPEEILNKRSGLSKAEMEQVREHPKYGYALLSKFKTVSLYTRHIPYQHHERADGSGYPRGLKNDQIDTLSKIVGLADVFDAMTSDKVYRQGMKYSEAIKELQACHNLFDEKLLSILCKSIAPFTIGEQVTLSSGHKAYVVKINPQVLDKPLVSVSQGSEKILLDLRREKDVRIVSS